jgi:hypothetical protein
MCFVGWTLFEPEAFWDEFLQASNISDGFTHSITQVDSLDHIRLIELLKSILTSVHNYKIQVGSIAAHRYDEWAEFAERALRLISCATSESDAERVLSMEKNVAGLHGTRFSFRTMEARLRVQTADFSPAVANHIDGVLTGTGDDEVVRAEYGSSDDESSEVGNDSDTEDFQIETRGERLRSD